MKADESQQQSASHESCKSNSEQWAEASGSEESLNLALPRRINIFEGTYVPEKVWVRNEGNRHIKSRGIG